MSYAWLGPVGELRPVPAPQSGVGVTAERARNEWQVLGGALVSQQSARVHRTWAWSYVWKTPALLAWIHELASGVVPGPIWLYTSKAAAENLAPPQLQSGGSGVVANRRVLAASDPELRPYTFPIPQDKELFVSALGDGTGSATIAIDDPNPTMVLFQNPNFEQSGGTIEVFRNHFRNPECVSATDTQQQGTVTNRAQVSISGHPTGAANAVQWTVSAPNDRVMQDISGTEFTATIGTVYQASVWVKAPVGAFYSVRMLNSGGAVTTGSFVSKAGTGEWQEVTGFTHTATAVDGGARLEVRHTSGATGTYQATLWTLGSEVPFSGRVSPDSDLQAMWIGTPDTSPSILRGSTASYVSNSWPTRFKTIQSSKWSASGSKSARIIPREDGATAGSFAEFGLSGLTIGRTYTLAAYIYLPGPLTGPLNVVSRQMRLTGATPPAITPIDSVPNVAGQHLYRAAFTASETSHTVRIFNGAGLGGGDMYLDMVTPVEGFRPDLMPLSGTTSAQTTLTPGTGRRAVVNVLSGKGSKLTITPTAGTGMYRITEGPHDGFMIGDGCIPVVIHDPEETLQRVMAGDIKSDFQILIKEVG